MTPRGGSPRSEAPVPDARAAGSDEVAAAKRVRGPRSLAGRVTLAAVAAVGGALTVAGVGVVIAAGQADRSALDRELTSLASRLDRPAVRELEPAQAPVLGAGDARTQAGNAVNEGGTTGLRQYGGRGPGGRGRGGPPPPLDPGSDRFARVVLPSGISIGQGTEVPAGFPLPSPASTPRSVESGGEDWRTITRDLPGGRTLQVAARLDPLQDDARRLQLVVLAALAGALLITALLTRTLTRIALSPLERLRGTAEEVAKTADLSKRVQVGEGPEEVDALAGDLNAMLARLGDASDGQRRALESARRFAADAGHELRTPLTSLEANLATGSVDPARRDARRLTALVEQLQALARGEAGPPARPEQVDLSELADSAVVDLRRRYPDVTATLEAPDGGPAVLGEPESLRMLLDNLLENAARHGRPGGTVAVTLSGHAAGAELIVDDDGPGIPAAERAAVLERFARGSGAQGEGTGLGLAIAAAQAVRHGGRLSLERSPVGGLRARVMLAPDAGPGT